MASKVAMSPCCTGCDLSVAAARRKETGLPVPFESAGRSCYPARTALPRTSPCAVETTGISSTVRWQTLSSQGFLKAIRPVVSTDAFARSDLIRELTWSSDIADQGKMRSAGQSEMSLPSNWVRGLGS